MDAVTLDTLPAWIVGVVMIYTGFIWMITRKLQIRMDSTIVAYTLLGWGSLYLLSLLSPEGANEDYMVARVFMSRVVILFICLSQSLPMTISYFRGRKREENGTT